MSDCSDHQCKERDSRIAELIETLGTERDEFGKRETELMSELGKLKYQVQEKDRDETERELVRMGRIISDQKVLIEEITKALEEFVDDGCCWDTKDEEECNECGWCIGKSALAKVKEMK